MGCQQNTEAKREGEFELIHSSIKSLRVVKTLRQTDGLVNCLFVWAAHGILLTSLAARWHDAWLNRKVRVVNKIECHLPKPLCHCRWLAVLVLLAMVRLEAQEALRVSLAGDAAAAQRKQAASTVGYYNLLWGPVAFRFSAGESTEYNDRVRYSDSGQNSGGSPSDVIFRPDVRANLNWPVTEWNSFNLSLDAGYSFYAQNRDLNQFYLNPGSGISFDVYVQDWVFTLHDLAKISQSITENPTQSGNNSSLLENDVGLSGLWDLDKTVVNFGLNHVNYLDLTTTGITNQLDSSSDNLNVNAGMRIIPEVLVGVSGGVSLLDGSKFTSASGSMQWDTGLFVSAQVSEHLSARLDAGRSVFLPNHPTTNSPSEISALYFQLSVTHQVNARVRYSLSAGHSIDFAYGQPQDRYYVRLDSNWDIIRKFTINLPLSWEQGEQVGTAQSVSYDQYSTGLTVSRGLTRKLSSSVYYRWVMETSNLASLNYTANIVGLSLTWQF
jgi:hypothetical protein